MYNWGMAIDSQAIEAEVIFFPAESGGRKNVVFAGFRPTFIYDGHYWDAALWFDGSPFIPDGKSITCYFSFHSPDQHVGKLVSGKEFDLWDGRVIARGRVIRIIDLHKSALHAISTGKTMR